MKPTWKSTFLRTTNLNVFFFFLEDALIGYWHKYDWFQTLLGQNSCLSDLVLFIFTRLSSRCPVIVCLYLWCGSETGLLLAAGWCRDAALGTRSCLRWVLLLTELCRWHAYCNPALGKPANSNSHSGLRQTDGVSFATQLYLLANPDLEMAIARFKTCGMIPSITDGSETLSLSCRFELPDIENGMCITHTASLLLQDIIMLSLKHYAQDVHPDLKPQRWGEVAQMAAVWEHAQSTVWIRNCQGFTQSSLTVCESNDKLKTSLALHHSESELKV